MQDTCRPYCSYNYVSTLSASLKLRLNVRMDPGRTRDHRGTQCLHGAHGTQWARWARVPVARLQSWVARVTDAGPHLKDGRGTFFVFMMAFQGLKRRIQGEELV